MKVSGFAWAGGLLLGCSLLGSSTAFAQTGSRTVSLTVRDITGQPRSDVAVYYTDGSGATIKADVQGNVTYIPNLGEKVTLIFESDFGTQAADVVLPDSSKIDIDAILDGNNLDTKIVPAAETTEPYQNLAPAALTPAYVQTSSVGPGSNSCAGATPIAGSGSFPYDTNGATTDGVPHAACLFFSQDDIGRDVWFAWTADCDGTATVETCGSINDSKMAVYNGGASCPPGDADLIVCNDDACGLLSRVTFAATNGSTYLIRVGNYPTNPANTSGNLTVSCMGGGGGGFTCTSGVGCQLPDQQGHGGSGVLAATSDRDPGFNFRVAEKVRATTGGSITSLCWWGGYFNFGSGSDCGTGATDVFEAQYYNDDSITGTVPGSPRAGPFSLTATKALTGNVLLGILNEWGFEATHPAVAVAANECVWLEISNDAPGSGTCAWLWSTAPPGDNAAAQSMAGVYAGVDYDMAVCFDIDIDPAGCPPPPPTNDLCMDALPISGTGSFPFDNTSASTDGPSHAACNKFSMPGTDHDLWYCWTAPCTGDVLVSTCGLTSVDTKLNVYDGCSCPVSDADLITCNDDTCGLQSQVTFNAMAGNTYLIRVGTFVGAAGGSGAFSISCVVLPDNDDCANATPVAIPSTTAGDTTLATTDTGAPLCGTSVTSPGVWYSVIGTGNTITASMCNGATAYDSKLSVYCGNCDPLSGLTCVVGNDDFCGLQSQVSWCSQAGAEYKILVHGFGGATGTFELVLSDNGQSCSGAVSCLTTGACCVGSANDMCVVTTEADCLAQGGVYLGDDTVCSGYEIGTCSSTFEDISGTGTNLGLGDDDGLSVGLGFTFDFFGTSHTMVSVGSNGYLTFGADATDFSNDPIPTAIDPNDIICPLWDDFDPSSGGAVYSQTLGAAPNRRFIAQWTNVPQFASADSNTFQAVLYEGSNRIEFRYGTITAEAFAGDYTVGIENATGTEGLSVPGSSVGAGDCVEVNSVDSPCPPPECHLVVGQGQGSDPFTAFGHTWTTQVEGIVEHYPVWLDDIPEFVLPGFVPNGRGVPTGHRQVHGQQAMVPVAEYHVEVVMWNPQVFPSNPEQNSNGLSVTVWANGDVTAVTYGQRDGMSISYEVVTQPNGVRTLRFPFSIDGL